MKYAEAAAPGLQEEFVAKLLPSDDDESDDRENKVPEELDGVISKFQSGNVMEKLAVLFLIDDTNDIKEFLKYLFVLI